MLVNKGDWLVREKDNSVFRVLLADADAFAVVLMRYNALKASWDSDYGVTLPFSNTAHTLKDIGFKLVPKAKATM